MKVYGQLEKAQLENLSSDPTPGVEGRVHVNTTSKKAKIDIDSALHEIITGDQVQNISNKIITTDDAITAKEIAAPSNPAAGYDKLYVNSTDKKLHILNSAGVDKAISGISPWVTSTPYAVDDTVTFTDSEIYKCVSAHTSGTFLTDQASGYWERQSEVSRNNLILNNSAEISTTGWTTYADAAATIPVDMTGGSPNITWNRNTTTPLMGVADFTLVKDAANRQGQGVAYTISMHKHMYAKTIQFSFDYTVVSGTYADSDLYIYVYDVTNGVLIEPVNVGIASVATGLPNKHIGYFQTSLTGTSYRVGIHVSSTSASAYTLQFSNFYVGEQVTSYGTIVTDWKSVTVTGAWTSNTTYTAYRRFVGDTAEYEISVNLSGAPNAANLNVTLPSGDVIDTSKVIDAAGNDYSLGIVSVLDSGTATYFGRLVANSSTVVAPRTSDSSGTYTSASVITATAPITFANGDKVFMKFSVPLVGKSSNVALSSDAGDGREVSCEACLSADQTGINPNSSFVKINFNKTTLDTVAAFDTSNYKYIVPASGTYSIGAVLGLSATNVLNDRYILAIYKNGSQLKSGSSIFAKASAYNSVGVSCIKNLVKGDYLEIYLYGGGDNSVNTLTAFSNTGTPNFSWFNINKINPGSQRIALTETYLKMSESPNQNYIYNGDMEIWNEGTARASVANSTYGAEGFLYNYAASSVVLDLNRSTSVPTVSGSVKAFNYSLEVDITTADASIAAGDRAAIYHAIEGNNFKNIHQKQITISFWVYATKTGTSCIFLTNSAFNRSYVSEYNISTTNTWEYKTITLNLDTSGTWLTTSGAIGCYIGFSLAAGSTFQTTANTWSAGNYTGTSNQVNHLDSTSNFFRITGIKLELGPYATPFTLMGGSSQGELAICQRYCYNPITDDPATDILGTGLCYSTTQGYCLVNLPVQMCKVPTLTVSNQAHFGLYNNAASAVATTALVLGGTTSKTCAAISATVASGLVQGNATVLTSNNASATMIFNARL